MEPVTAEATCAFCLETPFCQFFVVPIFVGSLFVGSGPT